MTNNSMSHIKVSLVSLFFQVFVSEIKYALRQKEFHSINLSKKRVII